MICILLPILSILTDDVILATTSDFPTSQEITSDNIKLDLSTKEESTTITTAINVSYEKTSLFGEFSKHATSSLTRVSVLILLHYLHNITWNFNFLQLVVNLTRVTYDGQISNIRVWFYPIWKWCTENIFLFVLP